MKNNIDPGLYTKDILENNARKNNIQEKNIRGICFRKRNIVLFCHLVIHSEEFLILHVLNLYRMSIVHLKNQNPYTTESPATQPV